MTPLRLPRLLAMLTIGLTIDLAGVSPAAAQPVPCDQGVIRLPDRTGTVQICSAFAAQVPALSKQLGEAVKLLGNQQQQIRELTRLTRAVNDSSGHLDGVRQARLLKTLSAELAKAESLGPGESRRTLEELGDRFDELRESLLKARSRPESATATDTAMKGALGEAISQLDWAGAQRQFSAIDARLQQIQGDLKDVKNGVERTETRVGAVDRKAELILDRTSRIELELTRPLTARESLARRGVQWDAKSYHQALMDGDTGLVAELVQAGWNPMSQAPAGLGDDGNSLGHFFGRTPSTSKTVAMLQVLRKHVDLSGPIVRLGGTSARRPATVAAYQCNRSMIEALAAAGVDVHVLDAPKAGADGLTFDPISNLKNWRQMSFHPFACTSRDRLAILALIEPPAYR